MRKKRNPHKRITALKAMELLADSHNPCSDDFKLEQMRRALRDHVKAALWKGGNR